MSRQVIEIVRDAIVLTVFLTAVTIWSGFLTGRF